MDCNNCGKPTWYGNPRSVVMEGGAVLHFCTWGCEVAYMNRTDNWGHRLEPNNKGETRQ